MNPLLQQAEAALRSGKPAAAHALCRQVLAQRPKDAHALYIIGRALITASRAEEAVEPLERCAKIEPRNVAVQLALADAFHDSGKTQAALARAEKAIRLQPGSPDAIATKARILARRGEHERARRLLEPRVKKGTETPVMAGVYADALQRVGRGDEALVLLDRHLAASTPPIERSVLGFQKGKLLERLERYDDAFAAYTLANETLGVREDPDAYRRRVDELMAVFDRETMARLPRAAHGLEQPVLVVGMPRTGSTLIEQIIAAHPDAATAGESSCLVDVIRDLPMKIGSTLVWPACAADMGAEDADAAGRAYAGTLATKAGDAARIVDKYLPNYEHLGLATLIVPGARLIDCRRDPVDTCLSCFAEPLRPGPHPFASNLTDLASRYRQYERLMAHWHQVLDGRLLTVRYEDLVADQEAVSRTLLEFIGLPWDDRCLRFHESRRDARTLSREQVRKPVYATSVKRSERFGSNLDPLREALAG